MPRQKKTLQRLPTPTEDIIDRTIIELPKEDVVDVIYEKPKPLEYTSEIPPSVNKSEKKSISSRSEGYKTESIKVVVEQKQEKPKRKARFERGSIQAKEHMAKLREIKAQKKAAIVVL